MSHISDENIALIRKHLRKNGITNRDLEEDLLDHICCNIQDQMHSGTDFNKAFQTVIKPFGVLREIQVKTNKAIINRGGILDNLGSVLNYFMTFLCFLLGVIFFVGPLLGAILIDAWFLIFLPLSIGGCLVCFRGFDYKKFEVIPIWR